MKSLAHALYFAGALCFIVAGIITWNTARFAQMEIEARLDTQGKVYIILEDYPDTVSVQGRVYEKTEKYVNVRFPIILEEL